MILSAIFLVFSNFYILFIETTIDINSSELQHLADHLTPEECRQLVVAAHFKSYEKPVALDEAERKIAKDIPCIELLHHWNSGKGEGKGETHEVLEHRLRQIGKVELADWLGKTVFHELAIDLNRSMENDFEDSTSISTSEIVLGPTLGPIIENDNPTEWTPFDSLLYAAVIGLVLLILGLCFKMCYTEICKWKNNRQKRKMKKKKSYDLLDSDTSGSESEDKFDVRNLTEKNMG